MTKRKVICISSTEQQLSNDHQIHNQIQGSIGMTEQLLVRLTKQNSSGKMYTLIYDNTQGTNKHKRFRPRGFVGCKKRDRK